MKNIKLINYIKEIELSLSPPQIFEKLYAGKYSFLLESARFNSKIGRYSYVVTNPFLVFKSKNNNIEIKSSIKKIKKKVKKPYEELRKLTEIYQVEKIPGIPNFVGGAVGFISYDMWYFFEKYKRGVVDDLSIPDMYFAFYDTVVSFDHQEEKMFILSCGRGEKEAEKKVKKVEDLLLKYPDSSFGWATNNQQPTTNNPKFTLTKSQFERIVKKVKKYIGAGDIYQANLSLRIEVPFKGDSWQLYKILREINPSPFASYLEFDDFKIVSCSPERLVKLENGEVETRPIAGTRPRGDTKSDDKNFAKDLILNEKERAEHIMLVDLERNDIGRVCSYGTVKVDEMMTVEDYSHVFHIVSNVVGNLHFDKHRLDLIKAVFPGGTITGCPKIRCMQIIDELEPTSRGIYTGSIGYLSFSGDLDLNIAIRTFLIKNNKAYIQAGAGVVYDSNPEREYYECLYKAEALLRAVEKLNKNKINIKIKKFKPLPDLRPTLQISP